MAQAVGPEPPDGTVLWPSSFNPQHAASPELKTPQVCRSPAEIEAHVPEGTEVLEFPPFPQQYPSPATVTPHEW